MKTLIDALALLRATKLDDAEVVRDVDEFMLDIMHLRKLVAADKPASVHGDDCYVVAAHAAIELMNMATYDEYGKLARTNCPIGTVTIDDVKVPKQPFVDVDDYYHKVNWYACGISRGLAEDAHSYLSDLWYDNERYGGNGDDGAYKRDN